MKRYSLFANPVTGAAAARAVTLPVTAISTLAATALIIGYGGSSAYAAIAVAATIPQLLPYADLGVGAGVVNATTESAEASRHAVAASLRVVVSAAVVLILIGVSGASFFSWTSVLNLQASGVGQLDLAISSAIVLFAVAMPLSLGQRVLTGLARNTTGIFVASIAPIVALGLTIVVVIFEAPVWLLALPGTVGLIISNTVAVVVSAKLISLHPRDLLSRATPVRYVLAQGLAFTVCTIFLTFLLPMGRVALAAGASPTALAEYSLVLQIYLPAASVVSAAGVALWPHFARHRNSGSLTWAVVSRMLWAFMLCALGAGICFVGFGPVVSSIISQGRITPTVGVYIFAALLLIVQSAQSVFGMVLTTPSGLWFQAVFAVPMGLSAIALTAISQNWVGAAAPFLSAATCMALFAVLPAAIRVARLSRKKS